MDLYSRFVFLDTSIFQQKNFQFLSYELGALKKLVALGQVTLLITDITIREVKSHISIKSQEAAAAIKKVKKEAMILRNFPSLPAFGLFGEINSYHMEAELCQQFDEFLNETNVKKLCVDMIKPSEVFELYFSVKPPFAVGKKSKEFSDAFVLETIKKWVGDNGFAVHIVSADTDMKNYCESTEHLHYTPQVDSYIEAVNRTYASEFAHVYDDALKALSQDIISAAQGAAEVLEVMFMDFVEITIEEKIQIESIKIKTAELMGVTEEYAEYSVEFELNVYTDLIYEEFFSDKHLEDDYQDVPRQRKARYISSMHAFVKIGFGYSLEKPVILNFDEYSSILFLEDAFEVLDTVA